MKRYNLTIPDELFNKMEEVAANEQTSVVDILKRYIKVGLLVDEVRSNGGKLLIRENNVDREIVIL